MVPAKDFKRRMVVEHRRCPAHDRAHPGPDAIGPRRGHALQDQGPQPQDEEPGREELPGHRCAERIELRAAADPVPLSRRRRAALHGRGQFQPVRHLGRGLARPGAVHDREHGGRRGAAGRTTRSSGSSCPTRSSCRSSTPRPGCGATPPPDGPSRRPSRPAWWSRSPSTSTRTRSSAWIPARANTSAAAVEHNPACTRRDFPKVGTSPGSDPARVRSRSARCQSGVRVARTEGPTPTPGKSGPARA